MKNHWIYFGAALAVGYSMASTLATYPGGMQAYDLGHSLGASFA